MNNRYSKMRAKRRAARNRAKFMRSAATIVGSIALIPFGAILGYVMGMGLQP